jgi:fatty-acid desaturase
MMPNKIFDYIRVVVKTFMLIVGCWWLLDTIQHFSTEWFWIPLAIIYTTVVNDTFTHRICAHSMFPINTKSWLYKILTWFASADLGFGSVRQLTRDHALHHMYADQGPEDNENWRYYWYAGMAAGPLPAFTFKPPKNYAEYLRKQAEKHADIMSDPWTVFCSKYHVTISLVTMLVLYLLVPVILFKIFLMGRFLLSLMALTANAFGHMEKFPGSYRNYNTNDKSVNNIIFYYMFGCILTGIMQNNHHGQPRSATPNPRWWEFDLSKPFLYGIRYCIEKK